MTRRLQDLRLVITGASAGIGAALARQAHAAGCQLVLAARRRDRLEALNAELGGRHLVVEADVAIPADCERLIATAASRGRIDVLVCNAGYGLARPVATTTAADWDAIWRTNVLGSVDCIRAALPHLHGQELQDGWRGQIMLVSSILARRARALGAAYSATKAAQLSIAEALRVELREARIAVTSVHPVGTDSEFVVAAGKVGGTPWPVTKAEPRQTSEQVAKAMLAGIRRPRPEVWPLWWSRYAVGLATLMPGVVDRVMARTFTKPR